MRRLVLLCVLFASPALAQVSVNSGALDQLQPSQPAPASPPARPPAPPAKRPAPHRAAHPAARPAPAAPPPARPAAPLPVTVAPAPPPAAVLPPVETPGRTVPPPSPVPVLPEASGGASTLPGGVRITFGPGSADLNPATDTALRSLARAVKSDANVNLRLYAYAAGSADDPSTPRRLSLSRALAARAVLISEGIVSTRIYPYALGATASDGPPDRVDVTDGPPSAAPAQ